ncbi:hypothetical protein vBStySLmqsSP_1119 [Salmonella phage vB_StyS-LmqsSP1]|uniref:Uncharacterized protein n=1 Tax=Salmonella phage vB_StyS-LmqsSP1 TaxID=2749424 RepID=A0AAE7TPZ1_9CAUD|nr:hypothetical protein vBStySLmqsSP_1119 [Salmonella phage vB_StyS-LmqsSP1]
MNDRMKEVREELRAMRIDALRWRALVNAFVKGDTGVIYSGIAVNFCFNSPTEIEVETRLTTYLNEVDLKEGGTSEEFKTKVLTSWVDSLIQNKEKSNES